MTLPSALSLFAVAPPGLESVVAAELVELGLSPCKAVPGGVEFTGDVAALCRANLHLRCAHRILWRLGAFSASKLPELRHKTALLPWALVATPGARVRLRVTCHASRIYHSGAAAERIMQGIGEALGGAVEKAAPSADDEDADAAELVVVARIVKNEVTLSVDSSGEHLHRRGYRQRVCKAPLRETLAACCLRLCGWPPASADAAFLDPMCGSGTLVIEAALAAAHMAPGLSRSFACERWPTFAGATLARAKQQARALVRSPAMVFCGSDRDVGAVAAATENAERAGVSAFVRFEHRAISAARPSGPHGLLLTNPPYGARLGEVMRLRDLYASLGNVYRRYFPTWRLAFLASSPQLVHAVQTSGVTVAPLGPILDNGGLKVRLYSPQGVASSPT